MLMSLAKVIDVGQKHICTMGLDLIEDTVFYDDILYIPRKKNNY